MLLDSGGISVHALSQLSCLAQLRSLQAVSSDGQQSCSQGFTGVARLCCIWTLTIPLCLAACCRCQSTRKLQQSRSRASTSCLRPRTAPWWRYVVAAMLLSSLGISRVCAYLCSPIFLQVRWSASRRDGVHERLLQRSSVFACSVHVSCPKAQHRSLNWHNTPQL